MPENGKLPEAMVSAAPGRYIQGQARRDTGAGGLAAAHFIHNGLTALEGKPPELVEELAAFCASVSPPVCLEDLGIGDADRDELLEVARAACAPGETIHNEPFEIHSEAVLNAMLAADALGGRLEVV